MRLRLFSLLFLLSINSFAQGLSEETELDREVWGEGAEPTEQNAGGKGSSSGTENEIPIDGGVVALVAGGAAYLGIRKSRTAKI